ncbi:hypothetical protein [Colwellia sp. RSH04]|uniref:hypothetical protein n=1 Tax=Colwellia sp. RSH04 TaxID=2305464 RepID=UPI000E590DF1|nr:hypothetical protein [Colwellia sp. RSH04]RHW74873.1 hypothetical protein D1094_16485 [Colwellia sp. RSH04]
MSTLKKITRLFLDKVEKNLLQRYCLLLWDFAYSINNEKLIKANKKQLKQAKYTILGAQHYHEEICLYPISSYKDLHKVLTLEQVNSESCFCFQIQEFDGTNRLVKKAYFTSSLLEKFNVTPLFLIPETWLISASLQHEIVQFEHSKRKYICVPQQYKNTFIELTGLLATKDDAYLSLGVSNEVDFSHVEEQWLLSKYTSVIGLFSIFKMMPGLRITKNTQGNQKDWRAFLVGASAISVSYVLLTSWYINSSLASVKEESVRLNEQLSPLLNIIEQTNQSRERAEEISSLYKIKGWEISAWKTIAPLFIDGVTISKVNFLKSGKVAIKVSSENISSSDVLALIINQPEVENAEFVGLIQKRKNFQRFTIVFQMVEQGG